ncbi:retrovirus-related pol polyprotein from transposon TNT 1-94 [Tanacetum coccineum]
MSNHSWIELMQDELHQFERLDVWELVHKPDGKNIIVVKWLWKNKSDAENIVIQHNSRLVMKGYKKEEGINFEESFAHVAHLEAIRTWKKVPCGLKQALRACYDKLSSFLIEHHFTKDADHARYKNDCKSTLGGLQFLGEKLVSWSSKKQDCIVMSTAETEYVSLSTCCAQVIWMRTQLLDYGYKYNKIPMYCNSKSSIAISCNPVQHSRTKHIDIRYHFINKHVEKGTVELYLSEYNTNLRIYLLKLFPKNTLST